MAIQAETAPTQRQLRYLRVLAARTGTTFTYPASRAKASGEIRRLRAISPAPRVTHEDTDPVIYATAVQPEEVDGYGSSATWRVKQPSRPASRPRRAVRDTVELARYTAAGEERVLRLDRAGALAQISDRPSAGRGRCYVVERDVEDDDPGAIDALLSEYVGQARQLDQVPMAAAAVREILGAGATDA